MRGLGLCLALACAACGDAPICQSEVFLAIETAQVVTDIDHVALGIQSDITVRTSLDAGELVHLEVVDADGDVTSKASERVDARGNVVFAGVSVWAPATTLRATADTSCGRGLDEVTIEVLAASGCELALVPAPALTEFYGATAVYNAATDPDPAAGHQASVHVTTRPGHTVELVRSTAEGDEVLARGTASASGLLRFDQTFTDGAYVLRATCQGATTPGESSLPAPLVVDTAPPTCAFTEPRSGSTLTARYDTNANLADGLQLAIAARAAGPDVAGEPAAISYREAGGTPTTVAATLDPQGDLVADASMVPTSLPAASFQFDLTTRDHAANACTAVATYEVNFDACDLAVTAPSAPLTRDANLAPADGSQADFTLAISPACAGATVTSTCGANAPGGTVPAGGQLTLRADVCASSPCETTGVCTFTVTGATTTTTSTSFVFDDQPPPVAVELVAPALVCGATVTSASDVAPAIPGVQITVRVASPGAARRFLELANGAGSSVVEVTGDQLVTLAPGANQLVGIGHDALGNIGRSATCVVTRSS